MAQLPTVEPARRPTSTTSIAASAAPSIAAKPAPVIEWDEGRITPVRTPGNRHALTMSRDGDGIIFGVVAPDRHSMKGSPLAALNDARARCGRHPGNHRYWSRLGPPALQRQTRLGLVVEALPPGPVTGSTTSRCRPDRRCRHHGDRGAELHSPGPARS